MLELDVPYALLLGAASLVPTVIGLVHALSRLERELSAAVSRQADVAGERDQLAFALRLVRQENARLRGELDEARQNAAARLVASPYRTTLLPPAPRLLDDENVGGGS